MSGQIHAGKLLFVFQQPCARIFGQRRIGKAEKLAFAAQRIKKPHLTGYHSAFQPRHGLKRRIDDRGKPAPLYTEAVERAAVYKRFQHFCVPPAAGAKQEILKAGIRSVRLPLGGDKAGEGGAHVFHGAQPEADILARRGKAGLAFVDVRRKDPVPGALEIGRIHVYLFPVARHRIQQRAGILPPVMAFQIGRAVGQHGVGRRMAFVESVFCKVAHLREHLFGNVRGHAVLSGAPDEADALFFHLGDLFLAHHPPDDVGASVGIAGERAEDHHHLFLIYYAAACGGKYRLKPRVGIRHRRRVGAVFEKARYRLHRSRAVKRDGAYDVFKAVRAQPHQQRAHPLAFQLEKPRGVARGKHRIGGRIVKAYARKRKLRLGLPYLLFGVVKHRQEAQPEEIHLQQPKLAYRFGRILGDDVAAVSGYRHILGYRPVGDDHAGRVGGGVARPALKLSRAVDQPPHLLVRPVSLPQLRALLQRRRDGDAGIARYQLCYLIHLCVGHAHDPARVPHGGAAGEGAEGYYLRYAVASVTGDDVVYHLAAAAVAEIYVKIRHAHTLRIKAALEQQRIFYRVHIGYAQQIRDKAAHAAAPPRAYGYAPAFGIADKIGNYKKIIGKAHAGDNRKLVLVSLRIFGRRGYRSGGDPCGIAALGLRAQIPGVCLARRQVERRQMQRAEIKIKAAPFGYPHGVFRRLRHIGKQRLHLLSRFEIELARFKRAVAGAERPARAYGHQHILKLGVAFAGIMDVVGGDDGHVQLGRKHQQRAVHRLLPVKPVTLQLEEEIVFSEHGQVLFNHLTRTVGISGKDALGYRAGQTAGQRDKPVRMRLQLLHVRAGALVKALRERAGDYGDKVFIPGFVLAKQHEVRDVGIDGELPVGKRTRRDIDLTAYYRLYARAAAGTVKRDRAVKHAVVGDRNGVHAGRLYGFGYAGDAALAVKQAVFGVKMKMHEPQSRTSRLSFHIYFPAISISLAILWLSPDLLTFFECMSASDARSRSGYSSRSRALSASSGDSRLNSLFFISSFMAATCSADAVAARS